MKTFTLGSLSVASCSSAYFTKSHLHLISSCLDVHECCQILNHRCKPHCYSIITLLIPLFALQITIFPQSFICKDLYILVPKALSFVANMSSIWHLPSHWRWLWHAPVECRQPLPLFSSVLFCGNIGKTPCSFENTSFITFYFRLY